VQVFYVRRGRVTGRKGLVVDKVEDVDQPELVARILEQLYGDAPAEDVPREVLVPVEPEQRELYEEFLSLTREKSKVRIRVPQRGEKRRLLETVTLNAQEAFARHKLKRASDHKRAGPGAAGPAGGTRPPGGAASDRVLRHLQPPGDGDRRVDDGPRRRVPKRSDYRHFKVKHEGQDDFAAMEEVLTRRFRRYLDERDEGARAGKRFAYPPNLLVIDGGKGQLNVAVRVLEELGLEDICVVGLAKRFEEVYKPRPLGPDPHPTRLGGAVPAAAGA